MNYKKIWIFLLFAFGLSWLIALVLRLLNLPIGAGSQSVTALVLMIAYMYMPAFSAFLVQKIIFKQEIKKPLLISFRINIFFLWALLIPLILVFLTTVIGYLFTSITFDPDMAGIKEMFGSSLTAEQLQEMEAQIDKLPFHPIWLAIGQGLIAAVTVNALAGFGEELGWRGFLVNEFKEMNFIKASLIIGVIWGIWHAPIILMGHNYPEHPQWGVLFMTVFCILLSFLFLYVTIKAKSVIAASVMHGSINAFFGITLMISRGGNDLILGLAGVSGFIAMGITIMLFFIFDRWVSKERIMTGKIGSYL